MQRLSRGSTSCLDQRVHAVPVRQRLLLSFAQKGGCTDAWTRENQETRMTRGGGGLTGQPTRPSSLHPSLHSSLLIHLNYLLHLSAPPPSSPDNIWANGWGGHQELMAHYKAKLYHAQPKAHENGSSAPDGVSIPVSRVCYAATVALKQQPACAALTEPRARSCRPAGWTRPPKLPAMLRSIRHKVRAGARCVYSTLPRARACAQALTHDSTQCCHKCMLTHKARR